MNQNENWQAASPSAMERRCSSVGMPDLILVELDAATIMDGDTCVTEDITTCGAVREKCPVCKGVHLQLVLCQKNVHVEHLFCTQCTRRFDACFADGTSALRT